MTVLESSPPAQQATTAIDPIAMLKPRRKITGISAILLPFNDDNSIDWESFTAHVARTAEHGLAPAVNMDTGYVNLIDQATRREVLARTQETLAGNSNYMAGAFVPAKRGDKWDPSATQEQMALIQQYGGTPVVFQSFPLTSQSPDKIVASYAQLGSDCPEFIAFELGKMFAPFGQIYDLETYEGLLSIPQCSGAKHSSLRRDLEWQRLQLRDRVRPDFKVYTGNDLAVDMVMYGSDYLLGLSTFAPDLFAQRDAMWEAGDPGFYELNDLIQYLGFFAFRPTVPAYKHSAAMFLKLRGWIKSDNPHPDGDRRPESDREVLRDIAERLGVLEAA
ncbi:MAG: dihydrodipicolinate synthase family protein [Caldilineaceae bacterium]|nr:dihydrodipicolinate synthase family protein [Caldilineaceae bacterium]